MLKLLTEYMPGATRGRKSPARSACPASAYSPACCAREGGNGTKTPHGIHAGSHTGAGVSCSVSLSCVGLFSCLLRPGGGGGNGTKTPHGIHAGSHTGAGVSCSVSLSCVALFSCLLRPGGGGGNGTKTPHGIHAGSHTGAGVSCSVSLSCVALFSCLLRPGGGVMGLKLLTEYMPGATRGPKSPARSACPASAYSPACCAREGGGGNGTKNPHGIHAGSHTGAGVSCSVSLSCVGSFSCLLRPGGGGVMAQSGTTDRRFQELSLSQCQFSEGKCNVLWKYLFSPGGYRSHRTIF